MLILKTLFTAKIKNIHGFRIILLTSLFFSWCFLFEFFLSLSHTNSLFRLAHILLKNHKSDDDEREKFLFCFYLIKISIDIVIYFEINSQLCVYNLLLNNKYEKENILLILALCFKYVTVYQ